MKRAVVADDPQVVGVLESGVLLGGASRVIAAIWNAARESRTGAAFARVIGVWRGLPISERRLATSVLLAAAAATHVALVITGDRQAGWLWLAAPAAVLSVALMVALTSRAETGD